MNKYTRRLIARLSKPLPWGGVGVGRWVGRWVGLCLFLGLLLLSCSYDETLTLCPLQVQVVYEAAAFAEPTDAHVRVELKDSRAQVFVDSTGTDRTAHFLVPPGIYEASTTASYVDSTDVTWWRYNFNGVRSMIVVSPDSLNQVDMQVRVSRRRIVH